jgi:hypothetical protein
MTRSNWQVEDGAEPSWVNNSPPVKISTLRGDRILGAFAETEALVGLDNVYSDPAADRLPRRCHSSRVREQGPEPRAVARERGSESYSENVRSGLRKLEAAFGRPFSC